MRVGHTFRPSVPPIASHQKRVGHVTPGPVPNGADHQLTRFGFGAYLLSEGVSVTEAFAKVVNAQARGRQSGGRFFAVR